MAKNNKFKKSVVSKLDINLFNLISKDWGVLTVQAQDKVNAMTVSWVQVGHMWNKNVVTVYVRPQRYTYDFIDQQETFSLAFFDEEYRDQLAYLGKATGKNEDKLKTCGFTTTQVEGTAVIEQAKLVFVLRKLFVADIKQEQFVDQGVVKRCYPKKDFHRAYTAEIVQVLLKP